MTIGQKIKWNCRKCYLDLLIKSIESYWQSVLSPLPVELGLNADATASKQTDSKKTAIAIFNKPIIE